MYAEDRKTEIKKNEPKIESFFGTSGTQTV